MASVWARTLTMKCYTVFRFLGRFFSIKATMKHPIGYRLLCLIVGAIGSAITFATSPTLAVVSMRGRSTLLGAIRLRY